MARLLKYLPLLVPLIRKARRDPRFARALQKVRTMVQPKPGTTSQKR